MDTNESNKKIASSSEVPDARVARCVTMHPYYGCPHHAPTQHMFFVGTNAHVLCIKRMLFKTDITIIHSHEGPVCHIDWIFGSGTRSSISSIQEHTGQQQSPSLVAWTNEKGMKVLETTRMQKVGFVPIPPAPKNHDTRITCTTLRWITVSWDSSRGSIATSKGGGLTPKVKSPQRLATRLAAQEDNESLFRRRRSLDQQQEDCSRTIDRPSEEMYRRPLGHEARLACAWCGTVLLIDVLEKVDGLNILFLQPVCWIQIEGIKNNPTNVLGISTLSNNYNERDQTSHSSRYVTITTEVSHQLCRWDGQVLAIDTLDIECANGPFLLSQNRIIYMKRRTVAEHVHWLLQRNQKEEAIALVSKRAPELIDKVTRHTVNNISPEDVPAAVASCTIRPQLWPDVIQGCTDINTLWLLAHNTIPSMVSLILQQFLNCINTTTDNNHTILLKICHLLLHHQNLTWNETLLKNIRNRIEPDTGQTSVVLLELWVQFLLQRSIKLNSSTIKSLLRMQASSRTIFKFLKIAPPPSIESVNILALFHCDVYRATTFFVTHRPKDYRNPEDKLSSPSSTYQVLLTPSLDDDIKSTRTPSNVITPMSMEDDDDNDSSTLVFDPQYVLGSLSKYESYQLVYLKQLAQEGIILHSRLTPLLCKQEPHNLSAFVPILDNESLSQAKLTEPYPSSSSTSIPISLSSCVPILLKRGEIPEAISLALNQGLLCLALEIIAKVPNGSNYSQTIVDTILQQPLFVAPFIALLTHTDILDIKPSNVGLSVSNIIHQLPYGFILPKFRESMEASINWTTLKGNLLRAFHNIQSTALDEHSNRNYHHRLRSHVTIDPKVLFESTGNDGSRSFTVQLPRVRRVI